MNTRRDEDQPITCLVADDHPAVRDLVAKYLSEQGLVVAGTAQDGRQALNAIVELEPDVALLDVRMPQLGGIEVARRLSGGPTRTAVILYTGFGDREHQMFVIQTQAGESRPGFVDVPVVAEPLGDASEPVSIAMTAACLDGFV